VAPLAEDRKSWVEKKLKGLDEAYSEGRGKLEERSAELLKELQGKLKEKESELLDSLKKRK
jgi:hypothetical protein